MKTENANVISRFSFLVFFTNFSDRRPRTELLCQHRSEIFSERHECETKIIRSFVGRLKLTKILRISLAKPP